MSIWLKRIVSGLVIALIIAVVGLAIFLLTFNPNAYKSRLEDLVLSRYGRILTIQGDIGLSLFPRIGLSVDGVSLSDRDSKSLFVSVDSARFAVAVWPLLSNQLVVDHVAVNGLKAWVVRDAKGHFNFDDLIESQQPAAGPAGAAPGTPAAAPAAAESGSDSDSGLNIDIAGLELKGGQIHYQDLRDGISGEVTDIEANTGRVTYDQPFDVALKGTLKGTDPVQDTKLDAQALLRLDPRARAYSAQKISVQLAGRLGNLDRGRITLKGNLAYDGLKRSFSASTLELAVAGDIVGAHPIQGVQASLSAAQLGLNSRSAELQVSKLALRATGKDQGRALDLALDAPSLLVSPATAKGDPVAATFKWSGDDTLATSLKLDGLSGNANELRFRAVALDSQFAQGRRLLRLRLASPLSWDNSLRKGSLSAIKGDVGVQDQALPHGGFEAPMIGSVHVDLVRDVLDADLSAVLDGGQAAFKTQVTQLADPHVRFDFSAEKLDLNRWLPTAPEAAKPAAQDPAAAQAASGAKPEARADTKAAVPAQADAKAAPAPAQVTAKMAQPAVIDLSFLKGRHVAGTLKVRDLRVRDVQLTDASAQVDLDKDALTVSKLAARLYEGTLGGQFSAAADQTLALRLALDKVSVAPFMQALGVQGLISGPGSAQVDVRTQGRSVPEFEKALAGHVAWQMREGTLHGVDASQTLSDVSSSLGNVLKGRLDAVPSPFQKGRSTPFSNLEGRIDLKDGVGTVSKLSVVSALVRVGEGKPALINVPDRSLDLMLQIQVAAKPPKALAPTLGSLLGATIPVRVSGSWTHPDYTVMWADVHNQTVQQALKSGLMELLSGKDLIQQALPLPEPEPKAKASPAPKAGDAVERLGNALKGLLGQ